MSNEIQVFVEKLKSGKFLCKIPSIFNSFLIFDRLPESILDVLFFNEILIDFSSKTISLQSTQFKKIILNINESGYDELKVSVYEALKKYTSNITGKNSNNTLELTDIELIYTINYLYDYFINNSDIEDESLNYHRNDSISYCNRSPDEHGPVVNFVYSKELERDIPQLKKYKNLCKDVNIIINEYFKKYHPLKIVNQVKKISKKDIIEVRVSNSFEYSIKDQCSGFNKKLYANTSNLTFKELIFDYCKTNKTKYIDYPEVEIVDLNSSESLWDETKAVYYAFIFDPTTYYTAILGNDQYFDNRYKEYKNENFIHLCSFKITKEQYDMIEIEYKHQFELLCELLSIE